MSEAGPSHTTPEFATEKELTTRVNSVNPSPLEAPTRVLPAFDNQNQPKAHLNPFPTDRYSDGSWLLE